jgi:hypothetical protein
VRRVSRELLSQGVCFLVFIITHARCYSVFDADDDDDDDFPVVGGRLVDFLSRVVFVNDLLTV